LYDGVHRGDDPDSKKGAEKSKQGKHRVNTKLTNVIAFLNVVCIVYQLQTVYIFVLNLYDISTDF
jgi:hypothetical protein